MPLYDRSYMRDPLAPSGPSGLTIVIATLVGVFLLQALLSLGSMRPTALHPYFALSLDQITGGLLWTPLSYGLLHASPWHLIGNLLIIFFIGRIVEPGIGRTRFLKLFVTGVLVGGAFWMLIKLIQYQIFGGPGFLQVPLVGASAGGMAVLIYFCIWRANEYITLLLFFVLPVRLKPKWIGWAVLGIEMFSFLFYEWQGVANSGGQFVANSAHLGGMAVGLFFYLAHHRPEYFGGSLAETSSPAPKVEKPRWLKKREAGKTPQTHQEVNLTSRHELKGEVDRILDKINNQGFGSLSPEEKRILDRARDVLKR